MEPFPRRAAAAGFLVAAILAAWAGSFSVPFQYDDLHTVRENPALQAGDFRAILSGLRPLSVVSLWVDHRLWGEAPAGYHATNLVLHAANAGLVWNVAGRFAGPLGAFLAAAAFALHPLQVEGVTYVSGRADLLAALFMLAGAALFLRPGPAIGTAGRALLAVLGVAATLSKESGAVYPVWLFLLDRARARRDASAGPAIQWKIHAWTVGAILGIALAQAAWSGESHVARVMRTAGGWQAALGYLLSQCEAVPRALLLAAWPHGLTINHEVPLPFPAEGIDPALPFTVANFLSAAVSWWNAGCTRGILVAAAMLGFLRFAAGSGWAWRLSAGWFVLQLAPAALVPLHDPFQEHRLYLPLVGLFLGMAIGGERLAAAIPSRRLAALAGAALVLWGAHTHARNVVWQDARSLWGEAVAVFPRNPRAHNNIGAAWGATGSPRRADQAYARASSIGGQSDEMSVLVLWNRFAGAVETGEIRAADGFLARMQGLYAADPDRMLAVLGVPRLGIDEPVCRWAVEGGGPPETLAWATVLVEKAAALDPAPTAWANLGSLYALQGRWDDAAFRFRAALTEHLRREGAGRKTGLETELRVSLAQALAHSGRPAEAGEILAPVAGDPRAAEILRVLQGPGR